MHDVSWSREDRMNTSIKISWGYASGGPLIGRRAPIHLYGIKVEATSEFLLHVGLQETSALPFVSKSPRANINRGIRRIDKW